VDEVLAVGDAEFQRKCIGKMTEVAHHGRTVLFVSHNMNAILNLCGRGIVLERGRLVFDGAVEAAVASYLGSVQTPTSGYVDLATAAGRDSGLPAMILGVGVRPLRGKDYVTTVSTGDDLAFDIHFDCGSETIDVAQITLSAADGQRLLTVGTHLTPDAPDGLTGRGMITCELRQLPLAEGNYDIAVRLTRRMPWHDVDAVERALRFDVDSNDYYGTGLQPGPDQGAIAWRSTWALQPGTGAQQ